MRNPNPTAIFAIETSLHRKEQLLKTRNRPLKRLSVPSLARSTFLVLAATLLIATPTQAVLLGTYTFDENGLATWTGTGGQPPAGTPINGGGVAYDITVTGGDLTPFIGKTFGFTEPGSSDLSDVVLIAGAKKLEFYSDSVDGANDLADLQNGVAFSTKFPTIDFRREEVGLEGGRNGVTFSANVGQGNQVKFVAISDVPEPSTLLLLGTGLAGLLGYVSNRMGRSFSGEMNRQA